MSWLRESRILVATVLAALLACPPAQALISLNEGRERIFVNASVAVSRDSNIFANSDNRGDFVYSTSLSAEYTRRVGWIGVNANVGVGSSRFATIKGQDFDNPSISLEFTKQTGRTTGSITFSGARESRADASTNIRSTSWNVPIGFNFKYPISGTYTLSGTLGYSSRRYLDETVFTSLSTYSSSLDLFKILSTERELITGYRYRYSESSRNSVDTDHSFSLGISGKVIRGIKGHIRAGYLTHSSHGRKEGDTKNHSWYLVGGPSYSFSRKLGVNISFSKDVSISATGAIVDNTSLSLTSTYAYTSHWSATVGGDFGDSRYLGETGRIILNPGPPPVLGPHRHDTYISWDASVGYSMNEHLKTSLTYSWFHNWSTLAFADFIRSSWSLSASTRW